jgi:Ca2+/Na+ antiporter
MKEKKKRYLQPNAVLITSNEKKVSIMFLILFSMFNLFFGCMGLVSIFLPFVLVAFVFWLISVERKKRYEMESHLYSEAGAKGDELHDSERRVQLSRKKNNMEKGIIFISIGVGISLCFLFFAFVEKIFLFAMSVGFIPATIGLGYLLIHFLEQKKK